MIAAKKIFLYSTLAFSLIISTQGLAQKTPWKGWASANLNIPVTKKLDVRISHLRAYDVTNGGNDFNQTQLRASYDVTKRIKFYIGGLTTQIPGSTTGARNRFFIKADYKLPIANTVSWINGIQGEVNSANETRFKYRVILQSRLGLKNRLPFLNLAPSVSYSLYYNIGGNTIQYYDKAGNKTIQQTPDGFHRGRFYFNLNSKINNRFNITAYLMMQREFNLMSSDYRKVNVLNPVSGKIRRQFDDFNVAGLTVNISLGKKGGKKPLIEN